MQTSNTLYKDIVLIGGGHAHAIVIKMWGMKPVAGVRLTLISSEAQTPYSGMLPGLVSGHYDFNQTHIDLYQLCSWANVRFICATVTGLDSTNKSISLDSRPAIEYDLLSINTGSTPNIHQTPGASHFATGVKPIAQFYQKWLHLQQRIQTAATPLNIALVGAGAGGFELLMAMQHYAKEHQQSVTHQFHWVVSGNQVLTSHNKQVRHQALRSCHEAGIKVHFDFSVNQVFNDSIQAVDKQSTPVKNKTIKTDEVIWCTAAIAASWPQKAGLAIDSQGFIAINQQLQSISHPQIFAAGDVATQIQSPRPKAGVFAVRQGPVLFKNLCNAILQRPLKTHNPQKSFLSLLATGDKRAIASKGHLCVTGEWVWGWKNAIDLKFMNMLKDLPTKSAMKSTTCDPSVYDNDLSHASNIAANKMRCGGCGAKVASSVLRETLKRVTNDISVLKREDVLIGLDSPDDAAVITTHGHALAQSVDQFRSIIDDPYLFAKIATNHALSDLHAMSSTPHSALSIVAMPYAGNEIQKRELYQLMYGVIEELNKAGCALTGGHTSEASELSLGLCVNGLVDKNEIKTKTAVTAGQQLIATKALGTGVIMAAHMQNKAAGADVQQCLQFMLQSNQQAAAILKQHHCSAMTDITGFGLIGHLLEMLRNNQVQCHLNLADVAVIQGALPLSKQGIKSTLFEKNIEAAQYVSASDEIKNSDLFPLLFDPQTSGGLMAWVNKEDSQSCLDELRESGYEAAIIGQAVTRSDLNTGRNNDINSKAIIDVR